MRAIALTIALAAPALLAGAAAAKELGYLELMKVRNACAADIAKFCNAVEPGKGRIMMCLKAHETEVSKPCIDAATPYAGRAQTLLNQ